MNDASPNTRTTRLAELQERLSAIVRGCATHDAVLALSEELAA